MPAPLSASLPAPLFHVPLNEWYIIPYKAMGRRLTLHFTPGSKRSKWGSYLEAWDLLREIEVRAGVDREWVEVRAE